jgi:hypothetical protein
VSAGWHAGSRSRLLLASLALAIAGLGLSGCKEVEETSSEGYEPAKLEPVGGADVKRVTFTAEGARRVGLRTAAIRRSGRQTLVPYRALIYDGHGTAYVYTSPESLSFLRQEVHVDRIEGDRVLLSHGPPTGTEVVTVGATEVYGAELEIAGGH